MLKLLIRKQFYECFKGYFVDSKTGKAKSRLKIIGMFALFAFVMLSICVIFFAFGLQLLPLFDIDYDWLYYAFFGLLSISLGVFSSAFNTSNSIYNAKDNDLLLSMPIKSKYILLSRISLTFGLCLLYSSTVWLPICILAFIHVGFSILKLILEIFLLICISMLSSAISCGVGYIVATVTNKTKNKSIITVILTLAFVGAYYYLCIRFSDFINEFILNADKLANAFSTWMNLIYQLGKAANGNIISFIIFSIVCLVVVTLCYLILNKSFAKIIANSNSINVSKTKVKYNAQNITSRILLKRELKRFTSLPIYLLNCGLGSVVVLVVAIVFVFKQNDIVPLIQMLTDEIPEILEYIPLVIFTIICSIISINASTVPSVSLEGKSLWIIKSLPIRTIDILQAKVTLQLLLNGIPSVVSVLIICIVFSLDFNRTICVIVLTALFILVHASIGILLALVNPNFTWTSETQPVKQSINVLFEMLASFVILAIVFGGFVLLNNKINFYIYFEILVLFFVAVEIALKKILLSWGVKKFNSL